MAARRNRAPREPDAPAPAPAPVIQIQRRAKDPPCFEGKPQDDVVAWLVDYQDTADFNMWTPEESLRQVRWALTGFAKNWYRNLNPQPATFPAFCDAIRAAFKHPAYDSGVASQLRNRNQGMDESPVVYCFEKLNLCARVDPQMTEAVKLDHLIRGMKPTLVEKIYPFMNFANPDTGAFVQLVQLHHQAKWVANSNGWTPPETEQPVPQLSIGTPGSSSHPPSTPSGESSLVTQAQLTSFEKKLTAKLEKELKGELDRHKADLKTEMREIQEKGFGELLIGVGKAVRDELQKNGVGNQQKRSFGGGNSSGNRFNGGNFGKRRRTEDGRPICYECNTPGHIAKNCGNPGRSHQQPIKPTTGNAPKN